jgi:ATP-dependent Clp protease adaptor protein ClpS
MSDQAGEKGSSGTAVVDAPSVKDAAKGKQRTKPAEPARKPAIQPPYAVVVLNDDDHTYDYVIDVLCRVCRHPAEKALKLAQQIDRTGRAVVWSGSLEVAELKRDQIRGMGPDFYAALPVMYPLGVVLEPMPQ